MVVMLASQLVAAEPKSLVHSLEPYLKQIGLSALAAAVFKDGVVTASGAVGTRRLGEDLPVKIDDCFHLGSDGKAFTALLAGAMFERIGQKTWEELVEERIIQPLSLGTAGFGPQASLGKSKT